MFRFANFLLPALAGAVLLTGAASAGNLTAVPTCQSFQLDGQPASFDAYSINGSNYLPLRAVSAKLGCQVTYDADANLISIVRGGGTQDPQDAPAAPPGGTVCVPATQQVEIDHQRASLSGYNIGGSTYYKLRDLGRALNFSVVYDGAKDIVSISTDAPYFEHQNNTIILMYHMVAAREDQFARTQWSLYTTADRLRQNIRDLRALGYECVSLDDYLSGQTQADKKYFILTFDDGYYSNLVYALPVLQEENATATIFTIVNRSEHEEIGFLFAGHLRDLEASNLVRIGSHTLSHRRMAELSEIEQKLEFEGSRSWLDGKLGRPTYLLAYPYGSYNKQTYEAARAAGFRAQMVQKRLFPADDLLVRMDISYDTDMANLTQTAVHN